MLIAAEHCWKPPHYSVHGTSVTSMCCLAHSRTANIASASPPCFKVITMWHFIRVDNQKRVLE